MKKTLLAILLTIILCFAVTGCADSSSEQTTSPASSSSATSTSETASSDTADAETDEEAAQEEEVEPAQSSTTMEGEGDVGSYHVVINGAKKDTDYEGNPVIVVSYTWTNNSDDTTSPMGSMMTEAFQDGVSMDTSILDHDYNDGMKDVRPGTSIDVDAVFTLTSDSTVEFEISAIEDMFKTLRQLLP